ncbi:MAG: zinc ribbon domain-containing protein [Promethearchaeota archaeon]
MDYEKKLKCRNTKCKSQMTVPIKLVIKGSKIVDIARCPNCHRSYKILLPPKDKDQWIHLTALGFFTCDVCGTSNEDNWEYRQHPFQSNYNRTRIVMKCKNCGKGRAKVASNKLWNDIYARIKKVTEIPSTYTLKCPHCNVEIAEGTKVCPGCKVVIGCEKCGAPIIFGAKFCNQCGGTIKKIKIKTPADLETYPENICPTCNEEYENGSIFCSVCGQELICDKCGIVIREGALFCVNCGDEIRKGELSE